MTLFSRMQLTSSVVLLTPEIYAKALNQAAAEGSGFIEPLSASSNNLSGERKGNLPYHIYQPNLTKRFGAAFLIDEDYSDGVFTFSSVATSNFLQLLGHPIFSSPEHMFQAICISHYYDALSNERFMEVMLTLFVALKPSKAIRPRGKSHNRSSSSSVTT